MKYKLTSTLEQPYNEYNHTIKYKSAPIKRRHKKTDIAPAIIIIIPFFGWPL